ncbi:sugar transporter [Shimia sp. SDUM112013]|uniref:sugar transporter n=1 Tax=Shimia sp. SDUM112013 TaxID=3136160 RepID=UPI0032EE3829
MFFLAPLAATLYYLYVIAEDQYASFVGFSVKSEESASATDLLGGLSSFSSSSSSDTDILFQFIQSQELISRINQSINLEEIYSRPDFDPVFSYNPDGTIEDLVSYWPWMVRVDLDAKTNLIELRVQAFTPEDAQLVAQEIVNESSAMINRLSAIAREDSTRYARADLEKALERLKLARENLTKFRSETQIVDPTADLQGQMGLLNSLEAQLASAQIELNLLLETAREGDPRIAQAERRIIVIKDLIDEERAKFGIGGNARTNERDYSTLVGEFERLMVELEYAQQTYLGAQAALDTALAEAQRTSRYLATFTQPTLAESARYPQRGIIALITGMFLLLAWSVGVLIFYSVRDRR